uniref:type 4b pilus protein PilO2 n=1 Tax=Pseudomonas sp. G(2018) TaxID=2502242 RepID=UPI0010FA3AC8
MSASVLIPGFGQAIAGLDWLPLPGLDGKSTEIKQLGRGVDAAWQFVWSVKGNEDEYVAFISKGEVKKRPVAASSLVRSAVAEDLYLALVEVEEGRYWAFAVKDGMPAKRMDRVGDATDLMGIVKDFLTSLPEPSKVPIYTDKPELFERLPFPVDVRSFSLEILGHSIKKRDFKKAEFSWYSAAPIGGIAIGVV